MVVIGLGYWCPNLVSNFAAASDASLNALCDLSEDALAQLLALYPGASEADEINTAQDIDVAVSTLSSETFLLRKAAPEAGKHVFVCKTFSENPKKALALAELAEQRNLILHTDLTFLYTPSVRKRRPILDSAIGGELNCIESTHTQV